MGYHSPYYAPPIGHTITLLPCHPIVRTLPPTQSFKKLETRSSMVVKSIIFLDCVSLSYLLAVYAYYLTAQEHLALGSVPGHCPVL